jgi:TPP-dependent trihydroxycyclohexane-1,2-dione (THcHDO) dehydratase
MAVCGDGGFMMNSQEMETAVRLKLNLVVLVIEDGAFGMIRWKQAVDRFPDFGMTFNNPDFVKYAEAYGAKGTRVNAIGDFVPALERAFAEGGVQLVAVPIDYSENIRVLVDELRERLTVAGAWRISVCRSAARSVLSAGPMSFSSDTPCWRIHRPACRYRYRPGSVCRPSSTFRGSGST